MSKTLIYVLIAVVIISLFFIIKSFINKNESFSNKIVKLKNTDSLESKLDEKTFIAILAHWCGHCKKLKKSNVLNKLSNFIKVIELDDTHPQAKDIMESANSKGFPTLIVYKNENYYKYNGDRSYESLLNFIK